MLQQPIPCGNPKILETIDHPNRSISKDWLKAIERDGLLFCGWCNKEELPKGRKKYCSNACANSSSAYCSPQADFYAFYWLMQRQDCKCAHCDFSYAEALKYQRDRGFKLDRARIIRDIERLKGLPERMERALARIPTFDPKFKPAPFINERGHYTITMYSNPHHDIKYYLAEEKDLKESISEHLASYFEGRKEAVVWRFNTPEVIRAYHREKGDRKQPEMDHIIPVALNGMAIGFDNVQILCHHCHKIKTAQDMKEITAKRRSEKAERVRLQADNPTKT